MRWLYSLLVFSLLAAPFAYAGQEVTKYQIPDIKEDFCGPGINYQFCRCAFHDESCEVMKMTQDQSYEFVIKEFRTWNKKRIQAMGEQCLASDGYWNKSSWSCKVCTEGDVLSGTKCVAPEDVGADAGGSCKVALQNLPNEWLRYSDFDDRLGGEVSYEVGEFNKVMDEIAAMTARAQALEYDLEIERQLRLEMKEYKTALVDNLRDNITKAIFRLAWVTYNTYKGAAGTKDSFGKILNPENAVEQVGATLKTIQGAIPASEKDLSFDTSKTEGQVKSIAWNSTLEAIESVGDPQAVATQVIKDLKGAAVGGPDITDEEVAVLREQHLDNQAVTEAIADSYADSALMRKELLELEKQIAEKYNELQSWKQQEYDRVKRSLEADCTE